MYNCHFVEREKTTTPLTPLSTPLPTGTSLTAVIQPPHRTFESMTLTVHHLGISQSERIVFLCEELGLEYNLVNYTRDPLTAPESLKSLPGNSTGKAPFIVDDAVNPPLALSESAAICQYIIETYGSGKLTTPVGQPGFVDYIYWFNYCSGSLQPALNTAMLVRMADLPPDDFLPKLSANSVQDALSHVNDRLSSHKWLAGEDFTAADIMMMFSLSTGRYWSGTSLKGYDHILRWLRDVAARPAYVRAMEKGDPEMQPLLSADGPEKTLIELGGVGNGIWKKKK